jgi:hypothetical protein
VPARCARAVRGGRKAFLLTALVIGTVPGVALGQSGAELFRKLRGFGNGKYLFGQVATWITRETGFGKSGITPEFSLRTPASPTISMTTRSRTRHGTAG